MTARSLSSVVRYRSQEELRHTSPTRYVLVTDDLRADTDMQFGPLLSYLYTWGAVSSLKPGSTAIISLIFG
jgi:hypothetical protein